MDSFGSFSPLQLGSARFGSEEHFGSEHEPDGQRVPPGEVPVHQNHQGKRRFRFGLCWGSVGTVRRAAAALIQTSVRVLVSRALTHGQMVPNLRVRDGAGQDSGPSRVFLWIRTSSRLEFRLVQWRHFIHITSCSSEPNPNRAGLDRKEHLETSVLRVQNFLVQMSPDLVSGGREADGGFWF